jgi:hypothetical protein
MSDDIKTGLALLREPFPADQISKLPKPTKQQTDEVRNDFTKGIRCGICGGWHHPKVVHLDYVGHAALTARLLKADESWNWEPLSIDQAGLPMIDQNGGLWIKLTVCGVTRLGYGNADGKSGGDAVKELIGDALRNAAMRFGAALDLWHKGEAPLMDEEKEQAVPAVKKEIGKPLDGAWKNITKEQKLVIEKTAASISDFFDANNIGNALDFYNEKNFSNEEKIALWTILKSAVKTAMNKEHEKRSLSNSKEKLLTDEQKDEINLANQARKYQ